MLQIILHSYQLSRFKAFPKYEKKTRVLKVFSTAEIFFFQNICWGRPIGQSEYICLCLLADTIYLKFQPVGEGKYIRIGRFVDPSMGFEKNISAAEKNLQNCRFFRVPRIGFKTGKLVRMYYNYPCSICFSFYFIIATCF